MTKRLNKKAVLAVSACMFACMSMFAPVKAEGWYDEYGNWVEVNPYVAAVNPYAGSWNNCTWSAWQIALEETGIALPEWGNAGSWLRRAAADGWMTSSIPVTGSIIVWSRHVGYVQSVSEDGNYVYVREGGFNGGYNEGWYPAYSSRIGQTLLGYIYILPTN